MRYILTSLLLLGSILLNAQKNVPEGRDIQRCYYDNESARYILIRHHLSNYPTIWKRNEDVNENYYYMSIWDAATGKLVTAYRFWADRWYVNNIEIYPYKVDLNDQQNLRYNPPFRNGTYFKINNNSVEVYDDSTNVIKYVIHPQDAYMKYDFSDKAAMIKQNADALFETEKQKGYALLMRKDTILPMERLQQFQLNRRNGKALVENTDCHLFIVTATDSLLVLKPNIIASGPVFSMIDSSKKFDEQILTYTHSFAGNTKDVQFTFTHEWSSATTPVSVLLFGKPNGDVSTYLNQAYKESLIAKQDSIKAVTEVRNLIKSKMLPADKIVVDTIRHVNPEDYSSHVIINSEFDKTFNRTLYVAVNAKDDSLYMLGRYNSERLVYMPEASIKKFNTSGYTIYRCSFTGDISYFIVVHTIQSSRKVYYFLTKRLDEKGLAANKKYFDEWDGNIASEKKETRETGNKNREYSVSLAEMQSTINKLCMSLRQSAIDNNNILSRGSPSTGTINASVKDVLAQYVKLGDYILNNENKINKLVANHDESKRYFEAVFKSLTELQTARRTIINTIESANKGEAFNLNSIKAAIFDMQMAARDILAKSDN